MHMCGRWTSQRWWLSQGCASFLSGCSAFVCECVFAVTMTGSGHRLQGWAGTVVPSFIKTCSPVRYIQGTTALAISGLCQYVQRRCVRGSVLTVLFILLDDCEPPTPFRYQGKPVSVWISLVAPLHPSQHPPLPTALLPHHSRHYCQHHGQVQCHQTCGESAG